MGKLNCLHKIIDLCERLEEEKGYCVFISYSGHVDLVGVSVRYSKEQYGVVIYNSEFYTDSKHFDKRVKECLVDLGKLLTEGKGNDLFRNQVRKEYEYYTSIGVPKTRAISNISKSLDIKVDEVKQLLEF